MDIYHLKLMNHLADLILMSSTTEFKLPLRQNYMLLWSVTPILYDKPDKVLTIQHESNITSINSESM
jgi:hypothetical protein